MLNPISEIVNETQDFPEISGGIVSFPSGDGDRIAVLDQGRTRFLKFLKRWEDKSETMFGLFAGSCDQGSFQTLKPNLKRNSDINGLSL